MGRVDRSGKADGRKNYRTVKDEKVTHGNRQTEQSGACDRDRYVQRNQPVWPGWTRQDTQNCTKCKYEQAEGGKEPGIDHM